MTRCREILDEILQRSQLTRDDANPLYAYRITLDEFERLRIELHSRFIIKGTLEADEECAAFCLFASEWFRRKYEQGVWSWKTIFDGFELLPATSRKVQTHREEFTLRGLRWWNLDVIRTAASRRYLATLVCQGGFPLNTLRNNGTSLSRVFRQCLRQHELYRSEPINDIVDACIDQLPVTLQEPEVRHLIGQVILAIADLRRKSDNASERGMSRRELLDEQFVGWHHQLPFRIEDPEAQSLLLTLLDATRARTLDRQPLAILTTLVEREGRLQLQRTLQHPVTLEERAFRSLCGLAPEHELYPRMTGFLNAGQARVQACTIAKPFEGDTLRLQTAGAGRLLGADACQQVTLLVRSGPELVTDAKLPGGEALPLSPWVFSVEEPFELLGVGSVQTRHESVYLAVHDSTEIHAEECEETSHRIDGRKIYRVAGQVRVEHEGITYHVRTREKNARDVLYELRGNRRRIGASEKEVWLGPPSVVELQLEEDVTQRILQSREVFWRPYPRGKWRPMSSDCIGDVFIRADVEGETRLMTRVTVLPKEFTLTTKPGRSINNGEWIFAGLGDAELHFAAPDHVELQRTRTPNEIIVKVVVQGERPDHITAKIRFTDQSTSEIDLVCPTESCELVGPAGRIIAERMAISIEQLDGLRVRLTQPGEQQPRLLELEHSQIVDTLSETSPGVWEYPLSFAKERAIGLLAASDDPDSEVKFGVSVGKSLNPSFQWRIGRYGYRLEPVRTPQCDSESTALDDSEDKSRVRVSNRKLRERLASESVSTRVIALNDPKLELPSEYLVREAPGVWDVEYGDADPGYYLITGKTEAGDILRPLRIANRPEHATMPTADKPEEDYGFDEVSLIADPERRREIWDAFFTRLSVDFGDPDWQKVEAVVQASMTLPVTTFEAVAGLTRNPVAVARFGILEPTNAKLWQRLEELPFLWCLVPVSAWIQSALRILRHFQKTIADLNLESDHIEQTIAAKSASFATASPDRYASMCCVSACLWHAQLVEHEHVKLIGQSAVHYRRMFNGLIDRHERFDNSLSWPNPQLSVAQEAQEILRTTPGLEIPESHPSQWAVINAPSLAAIHSVYGLPMSQTQVGDLKRLRSFDTEWFDAANYYTMYQVMSQRFHDDPEWISRIVLEEEACPVS